MTQASLAVVVRQQRRTRRRGPALAGVLAPVDLEHAFRLFKQVLGWPAPKIRDPAAADRWKRHHARDRQARGGRSGSRWPSGRTSRGKPGRAGRRLVCRSDQAEPSLVAKSAHRKSSPKQGPCPSVFFICRSTRREKGALSHPGAASAFQQGAEHARHVVAGVDELAGHLPSLSLQLWQR
jgi:hypothetical protein